MTDQNTFAIAKLQQKANDGDAQAQFDLALCYANGTGIEKNEALAFDWLNKSAEQGHANAQFALGLYYFLGKDRIEHTNLVNNLVSKWFRDKFKNDDVYSALDLAFTQANAIKFSGADDVLAFLWLKKAAEQNHAEAIYWLGQCYYEGIGIEQNFEQAFTEFKEAAELGIYEAQYLLARCYFDGTGVEQSDEFAFEWITKVTEQELENDLAEAYLFLGALYHNGRCVEQNDELAFEWFEKSAERGNALAQLRLAQCYENGIGVEGNYGLAKEWYEKAAAQGHAEANDWIARHYASIGAMYYSGHGLEQNDEEAFVWFTKAAELGSAIAYAALGQLYESGRGVEQSDELSFGCYKKAVEQYEYENVEGESSERVLANKYLADCYAQGKGVQKNEVLAAQIRQRFTPDEQRKAFLESIASIMEMPPTPGFAKQNIALRLALHNSYKEFDSAEEFVEKVFENANDVEKGYKQICLTTITQAKEIDKKNQELEEKNKELQESQKELEDMMSMFAHKFRSPLDAIIYNTTHENQVKLYTEAAQTMRGLLDIFSLISTDAALLKRKLMADNYGNSGLITTFSKALDMVLLHLLTNSNREKVRQHYIAYAKLNGKVDCNISRKIWREDYFELEQSLQTDWEQGFATLILQSASLAEKLDWVSKYFFTIQLIGFDREDIEFEEYGITESLLMMVINEIVVNVFKYYSSETKQPVIIEWVEKDGSQVIICRNPSYGSERTIFKGSQKGHIFLSTLARNIGSHFVKPIPQDEFMVEFGIPNELLISNR